jgi:hypothetical protein
MSLTYDHLVECFHIKSPLGFKRLPQTNCHRRAGGN